MAGENMTRMTPPNESNQVSVSHSVRWGNTLLELVAVLTLLGLLALAAVASFKPDTFGDLGARVDARRLAVDLMQARRRAIASGDNHLLAFQNNGGSLVGYTVSRRLPDSSIQGVDAEHLFPTNLSVTISPSDPEFTFEGAALAGYIITLTAPNRTWQVSVSQATGSVRVSEL